MRQSTQYDITIIGGGIVGLTLALAMVQAVQCESSSSQPLRICVIDKTMPKNTPLSGYSSRVSALSKTSINLLDALGVWQSMHRRQPYHRMKVWDKDGFGRIEFSADDIGQLSLGDIVENDVVVHALSNALNSIAQGANTVEFIYNDRPCETVNHGECVSVALESGKSFSTKLLVGADGANSWVKSQIGGAETFWDYGHNAIVANVRLQKHHKNTAWQAFTPNGPLAFLPMPEPDLVSIVWSQTSSKAEQLMGLSDDAFCKALLVDINNEFGLCTLDSPRLIFPLRMRYANTWVSNRMVLVGDAAHTIHPLAGQGANLGLSDVSVLVQVLRDCDLTQPHKLASRLRKYQRHRKAETLKAVATMEAFKQLFDGNAPVKRLVRNVGLSLANKNMALKKFFIEQASQN